MSLFFSGPKNEKQLLREILKINGKFGDELENKYASFVCDWHKVCEHIRSYKDEVAKIARQLGTTDEREGLQQTCQELQSQSAPPSARPRDAVIYGPIPSTAKTQAGSTIDDLVRMLSSKSDEVEKLKSQQENYREVKYKCNKLEEEKIKNKSVLEEHMRSKQQLEQKLKEHEFKLQEYKLNKKELEARNHSLQDEIKRMISVFEDKTARLNSALQAEQQKTSRFSHQFSKSELKEREAKVLDVLVVYRDCPQDLGANLKERMQKFHDNFQFTIVSWNVATKKSQFYSEHKSSVALLLYTPQNRTISQTAPELTSLFQRLKKKVNIYLPIFDVGNDRRPPVPDLPETISRIRESGWIVYNPADGASAKLNLKEDEWQKLEFMLVACSLKSADELPEIRRADI